MKKTFVFALAMASLSLVNLEAKAQSSDTTQTTQQPQTAPAQDEQRQLIKQEELPEAVKTALTSESLKDWTVSEVYKVAPDPADATAKATYEVFFTNADQKQAKAHFDEQGKMVEE